MVWVHIIVINRIKYEYLQLLSYLAHLPCFLMEYNHSVEVVAQHFKISILLDLLKLLATKKVRVMCLSEWDVCTCDSPTQLLDYSILCANAALFKVTSYSIPTGAHLVAASS